MVPPAQSETDAPMTGLLPANMSRCDVRRGLLHPCNPLSLGPQTGSAFQKSDRSVNCDGKGNGPSVLGQKAVVMTGRQALDFQIQKLIKAIQLLRDESLILPALMLFYATIDGLAWLQRKNQQGESTHCDFETWVDTYFLSDWSGDAAVTSQGLWAARCGLLHAQTAESRASRAGEVAEFWYRWGDLAIAPNDTRPAGDFVFVNPNQLLNALNPAITRFLAAVNTNEKLAKDVDEQGKKLWVDRILPPNIRENK